MNTDHTDTDGMEEDDDTDGTINIAPRRVIKEYRLAQGQTATLTPDEIASFLGKWMSAQGRYEASAGTTAKVFEHSFEKIFKCRPDQLTDGYVKRTAEGVEYVLYGTLANDRTTGLILGFRFDGGVSVRQKTEILPGEPGYTPAR
jgi:hypothetical protein